MIKFWLCVAATEQLLNWTLNAMMQIARLNLNAKAAIKFHRCFHKLKF